ncbi:uncharacterized protein Pyn_11233 [Prunus yedoensis var. nudiflora]|uniref:Small multi-drug export protein n=1 Tax=Prunus yedoensis var. nudiflora TaxID=2094558 RepID=A0A314YY72_PRUYE|nr:uncharacterized protein Pyn_11233 [Prunus yedoensis var. nudiflora]
MTTTLAIGLCICRNMVPLPFIILYLKRFASFLAGKNKAAARFLDILFVRAKEKAGLVEEFQWLGLMLFVAVPFPGTRAWTGAIIASILDMPFLGNSVCKFLWCCIGWASSKFAGEPWSQICNYH